MTVKSDKSVKKALDSRELNDSCNKKRPHVPNMEKLLNQISVEITRDRAVQLFISKIDMDYANEQKKLSEETSRPCVFTGGKFSGNYLFEKGFYGLTEIPTIFQENTDRKLEYCLLAWLDDIIVVVLNNLENSWTRNSRKRYISE